MEIFLWVLGIHVVEICGVALYFLLKKVNRMENVIQQQESYINALDIIGRELNDSLSQINTKVYVDNDEELSPVFQKVEELQSILNEIYNK